MIFEKSDNPLIDESIIKTLEDKFQKKLPKSYIQLLRQQNGGRTKNLCFKRKEIISIRFDNFVPVYEISGLGKREDGTPWTINGSDYFIKEWSLPSQVLLLFGDGHWWVCLDYRLGSENEPRISLIDPEFDTDIVLADSFKEFIESLVEIPEQEDDIDFSKFKVLD